MNDRPRQNPAYRLTHHAPRKGGTFLRDHPRQVESQPLTPVDTDLVYELVFLNFL
jgi:hypothetical protein